MGTGTYYCASRPDRLAPRTTSILAAREDFGQPASEAQAADSEPGWAGREARTPAHPAGRSAAGRGPAPHRPLAHAAWRGPPWADAARYFFSGSTTSTSPLSTEFSPKDDTAKRSVPE